MVQGPAVDRCPRCTVRCGGIPADGQPRRLAGLAPADPAAAVRARIAAAPSGAGLAAAGLPAGGRGLEHSPDRGARPRCDRLQRYAPHPGRQSGGDLAQRASRTMEGRRDAGARAAVGGAGHTLLQAAHARMGRAGQAHAGPVRAARTAAHAQRRAGDARDPRRDRPVRMVRHPDCAGLLLCRPAEGSGAGQQPACGGAGRPGLRARLCRLRPDRSHLLVDEGLAVLRAAGVPAHGLLPERAGGGRTASPC